MSASDMPLRRHLLERGTDGEVPPAQVVEHKWNLFRGIDAMGRGEAAATMLSCGILETMRKASMVAVGAMFV